MVKSYNCIADVINSREVFFVYLKLQTCECKEIKVVYIVTRIKARLKENSAVQLYPCRTKIDGKDVDFHKNMILVVIRRYHTALASRMLLLHFELFAKNCMEIVKMASKL